MKQKTGANFTKLLVFCTFLLVFAAVIFVFFKNSKTFLAQKSKTQNNVITFNIPGGWKIYQADRNYDFDIGYFKNGNKDQKLLCRINAITADLKRDPTFEQFMGTTLSGQLFTSVHSESDVWGQFAWRGHYIFPAKGLDEPAENERVLFKWKGNYIDLTLSYSQNEEAAIKTKCNEDFEYFLKNLKLI